MKSSVFLVLVVGVVLLWYLGRRERLAVSQNQTITPQGSSAVAAQSAATQQQSSPDQLFASMFNMIGSFFETVNTGVQQFTDRNG